jgi:uncharacterized protein (TIGR02300 family)
VAKSELGTKRVCPETGRKFYDLNKTPVISPYTGKIVPIAAPPRSRAETAPVARAVAPEVAEIVPEVAEAELVSLEDAEAEQQGKKKVAAPGVDVEADEDVEVDDTMDDATFIEQEEEGDEDVTDIIGDGIEKEDET